MSRDSIGGRWGCWAGTVVLVAELGEAYGHVAASAGCPAVSPASG